MLLSTIKSEILLFIRRNLKHTNDLNYIYLNVLTMNSIVDMSIYLRNESLLGAHVYTHFVELFIRNKIVNDISLSKTIKVRRDYFEQKKFKFTEFLLKLQGLNPKINPKVLSKINDKINEYGLAHEELTLLHIKLFIAELKLNKYYDDIHFILNHFNKAYKPLCFNNQQFDRILSDYAVFLKASDDVDFINNKVLLTNILKKNKIEIENNQILTLKNIDRFEDHCLKIDLIFKKLKWS